MDHHLNEDGLGAHYKILLYPIINNVLSVYCWVTMYDEALNELHFWKDLPRLLRFEMDIWP